MKSVLLAFTAATAVSGADIVSKFTCTDFEVPPFPVDNDITQLHPGHVSLTIALGDSITAAFSARSTLLEDRDIAWSGGKGDDTHLTLPFLLGKYGLGKAEMAMWREGFVV